VLGGAPERNLTSAGSDYFSVARKAGAGPDSLSHYLHLFAVQWIVGDRPEFRRAPNLLTPVATFAGRHIYKAIPAADRVLHGGGTLQVSDNRIAVHDCAPTEALVLSYHWHPALRCQPSCRVTRFPVDIDRVGFILVPAPHPADLMLWNSYDSW
jgi:hypothetical protein